MEKQEEFDGRSDFEKVGDFTEAKAVFAVIGNEKFYSKYTDTFHSNGDMLISTHGEIVLDFLKACSVTFVSDIAKKASEYVLTDKQRWCCAFEFIKIKHLYPAWVEAEIAKYEVA